MTAKCEACSKGIHKDCEIFIEKTGKDCACMNSDCVYLRVIVNQN